MTRFHGIPLPCVATGLATVALALCSAGPAGAVGPRPPIIRNTQPQQSASVFDERLPIHAPPRARAGAQTNPSTALLNEFFDRHTAMEYDQAAELATRMVELAPGAAEAHYNHACVMGRLYRRDAALASLERAIQCGWRNALHLSLDPDLEVIRSTPRYTAMLRQLDELDPPGAGTRAIPHVRWPAVVAGLYRDASTLLAGSDASTATIALIDGGRLVWSGSFGNPAGRFESEQLVPLLALGTLLHDGDAVEPGTDAPRNVLVSGPTVAGYRRDLLDVLNLHDTRLAWVREPGAPVRQVVHSTATDLGRLVAALCVPDQPVAAVDRLTDLASRLGLTRRGAPGSPTTFEVFDVSGPTVLVRWHPYLGRGVVVVTDGRGGRAARMFAEAAGLGAP